MQHDCPLGMVGSSSDTLPVRGIYHLSPLGKTHELDQETQTIVPGNHRIIEWLGVARTLRIHQPGGIWQVNNPGRCA